MERVGRVLRLRAATVRERLVVAHVQPLAYARGSYLRVRGAVCVYEPRQSGSGWSLHTYNRLLTRAARICVSGARFAFTSRDSQGAVGRCTRTTACLRARRVFACQGRGLRLRAATVRERLVVAHVQPLAYARGSYLRVRGAVCVYEPRQSGSGWSLHTYNRLLTRAARICASGARFAFTSRDSQGAVGRCTRTTACLRAWLVFERQGRGLRLRAATVRERLVVAHVQPLAYARGSYLRVRGAVCVYEPRQSGSGWSLHTYNRLLTRAARICVSGARFAFTSRDSQGAVGRCTRTTACLRARRVFACQGRGLRLRAATVRERLVVAHVQPLAYARGSYLRVRGAVCVYEPRQSGSGWSLHTYNRLLTRAARICVSGARFAFTSRDSQGAVGRCTRTTACLRARRVFACQGRGLRLRAATVRERLVVAHVQPLAYARGSYLRVRGAVCVYEPRQSGSGWSLHTYNRLLTRAARICVSGARFAFTSRDSQGAVGRCTRTTACLRARLVFACQGRGLRLRAATVRERLVVAHVQPLAYARGAYLRVRGAVCVYEPRQSGSGWSLHTYNRLLTRAARICAS